MDEKVLFWEPSEYCQLFWSHQIRKEVEESPESEDFVEYITIIIIILRARVIIIPNLTTFNLSNWTSKYEFCNEFV